jgi:hypothetical protein
MIKFNSAQVASATLGDKWSEVKVFDDLLNRAGGR